MIEINLIPESYRKSKRLKQILALAIGGGILGATVMVGLYVYTFAQVAILKGDISKLEMDRKQFEKTLSEIDVINKKTKVVEERLNSIKDLQDQQTVWILMMDELGRCVPNNLWMSSLTNKVESGGFRTFTCDGVSLFKEVIADFLIKLNSSTYFKNANLVTMSETTAVGLKAYSFKVTFQSIEEAKLRPPKQVEINSVSKTGIEGATYVNVDFKCSLSRIENWTISDKTPLPNLLCVITRDKRLLTGRFSPNVSLAIEKLKKNQTPKEYATAVEGGVQRAVEGYYRSSERELVVNEMKCYEVVVMYKTASKIEKGKSLDIKQRRIYCTKNGMGYVICCTDVSSGFDKSKEDFESIINSFKAL